MLYIQPFFDWLVQTTLIASVVICLILLIQRTLGGKLGPRWCYALWLVLLIRMVLPWAPSSRFSLFNLIPSWEGRTQSRQLSETAEQRGPSEASRTSGATEAIPAQQAKHDAVVQEQGTPKPVAPADGQAGSHRHLVWLSQVLPLLWLLGAIVFGAYVLVSDLALWRIVKRDRPLLNQPMLELFEECKAQMGVQSLVAVVPSEQVRSPGLFGFIRPRLLLPREMLDTATQDEMRYVFLHELAHLKRRDIYLGWLASLLQVLHWFNPLVWFAFYRMRADRELACDALVLTRTGQDKSQEYGGAIVGLVRRFSRPRPLPAMAGVIENRSQLKRRIAMITQFKNNSYRWSSLGIGVIAVLCTIAMIDPARGTGAASPAPEAKAPVTMRLVEKNFTSYASVSPDGRYLCDRDQAIEEGVIIIREFATGEQRSIKPTKDTADVSLPLYPVLSPDNKTVAYVVGRRGGGDGDLRLIGADGSGQRVLCPAWVTPVQWFPDGSRILGIRPGKTGIEIVSISVSDSSMQTIKALRGDIFKTTVRLSPDAKYVAYELSSKDTPAKGDIFAVEIDSKRETPLVQHPAADKLLGWTPDGRHILFTSDRMEAWSAWLLPVAEGQAQGAPKLVARNIGDVRPKGFAGNGSYCYEVAYNSGNVYTAAINLTAGQLMSASVPLAAAGQNAYADWSPDGKHLAYCSCPDPFRGPHVVRIRSLATGEERELLHKLPRVRCLRWSPDGRSLLASRLTVYEGDPDLMRRVCRVDVDTGDSTVLLQSEKSNVWQAELSPDEKTLYYSGTLAVVRRQIDSQEEKNVFEFPQKAGGVSLAWALSPDGEFIAAGFDEQTEKEKKHVTKIVIIPSEGGQITELLRRDEPAGEFSALAWSRDDKTVLFTVQRNFDTIEFWQVTTDGGQPRKITEADLGWCYDLRIHPDGQRIAFTTVHGFHELWVMENFLPQDAGK